MIRITLYKGAPFSNKYLQVMSLGRYSGDDARSVLDKYLADIPSISFDIENVYQENSGSLIFDLDIQNYHTDSIYDYNYMKVATDDTEIIQFKRYCFINSITIKNTVAIIEYEEDIWHSYSNGIMGISKAYLSNSRILDYKNQTHPYRITLSPYSLPTEYKSNDNAIIKNFINEWTISGNEGNVNIIVEIQYYKVDQAGEPTERKCGYYLLSRLNENPSINDVDYLYVLGEITTAINNLISKSSTALIIEPSQLQNQYRYKVGHIYVVPKCFEIYLQRSSTFSYTWVSIGNFALVGLNIYYDKRTLVQKTITNDFKNLSIGTFNTRIQLVNNGTDAIVKLSLSITHFSFQLFLELNNQIIDITSDFEIEAPIEALDSEKLSLLRLQREQKSQLLDKESAYLRMQKGYIPAEQIGNWLHSLAGGLSKNVIPAISGQLSVAGDYVKSIGSVDLVKSKYELSEKELERERVLNNAPLYSSNNGVFKNNYNFVNAYYGIFILEIVPDNTEFVNNSIKEYGYNTYQFINLLSLIGFEDAISIRAKGYNYNYIKFANISVYGLFTQEIANKLNDILMSGVKIWYEYTLQDDNN